MPSTFQSPHFEDDLGLSYRQRSSPIGIVGVALVALLSCASTVTSLIGAVGGVPLFD